jgi:hypothetical protein
MKCLEIFRLGSREIPRRERSEMAFNETLAPTPSSPTSTGFGGKPHRIIMSCRVPSLEDATTGAVMSGNTPGSGGMLPVVSRMARPSSRIVARPLVTE